MKYLLTVRLEFEAVDDVVARSSVRGMGAAVALTEAALMPRVTATAGRTKLQRLREGMPPRLLAKWPDE